MASDDWYRNQTWTPEAEAAFRTKLGRAKRKAQYLKIQASCLADVAPEATLTLLAEYFALGPDFDRASAYATQARALMALDRLEEAFDAYEAALRCEAAFPGLKTDAYLEYPMGIWSSGATMRSTRALAVLDDHSERPMFPVDHYRWHGLCALFLAAADQGEAARAHAALALEASRIGSSGLDHHADIGLVPTTEDAFGRQVRQIAEPLPLGRLNSLLKRFAPSTRRPPGSSRR